MASILKTYNTTRKSGQHIRWKLWYNSVGNPDDSGERNWNYGTTQEFWKGFQGKSGHRGHQGRKTINEIASIYEVHPGQVVKWKKLALEKLPEVMADGCSKDVRNAQPVDEEKLHQKIGQQAIEIDFLKKKLRQLGLLNE